MRAGRLRHRITIEQPTETQSSTGAVQTTWSTFATRWADIEFMKGRENFEAQAFQSTEPVKFTLREIAGVTKKMRIQWNSRTFDIESVQSVPSARHGSPQTIIFGEEKR